MPIVERPEAPIQRQNKEILIVTNSCFTRIAGFNFWLSIVIIIYHLITATIQFSFRFVESNVKETEMWNVRLDL